MPSLKVPLKARMARTPSRVGDIVPAPQDCAETRSGYAELPGDGVHRLCKLDIEGGDAAGVMGCQNHFHRLVNVAPFRVMIALFGHQRCAGHEPERFVEILEGEGSRNRLAAR